MLWVNGSARRRFRRRGAQTGSPLSTNTLRLTSSVHTRPVLARVSLPVPSSAEGARFSSTWRPNPDLPVRLGGGPPLSVQVRVKAGSAPFRGPNDHLTASLPSGTDSAPYFAEFVASS